MNRNFYSTLVPSVVLSATATSGIMFLMAFIFLRTTGSTLSTSYLLSVNMLAGLIFAPTGGWLADKKPKLALYFGEVSAALLCLVLANNITVVKANLLALMIFSFLLGATRDLQTPIQIKIPTNSNDQQKMALINFLTLFGSLLGPTIAAALIKYDWHSMLLGFCAAYILSALLGFLFSLTIERSDQNSRHAQTNTEQKLSTITLLRKPTVWRLILIFSAINFFIMPLTLIIEMWITSKSAQSGSMALWLQLSISVGMLLGNILPATVEAIKQKINRQTFIVAMCFSAIAMFAMAFGQNHLSLLILPLFVVGFSTSVASIYLLWQTPTLVEQEIQGRFFGLLSVSVTVFGPASFTIFGFLLGHFSISSILTICSICILSVVFSSNNFFRKIFDTKLDSSAIL